MKDILILTTATDDALDFLNMYVEAFDGIEIEVLQPIEYKGQEAKVIIGLGSEANTILRGESSITKERKIISRLGDIHTIISYSPSMHTMWLQGLPQGMNLYEEYERVFTMANDILEGKHQILDENIYEILDEADLRVALQKIKASEIITIDVETNNCDTDLTRNSIYKENYEILCLGVAVNETDAYVIHKDLLTKELIHIITKDKVLLGANIKFDIACIENQYNMKLQYKDIEDIILYQFVHNQNVIGIGLKPSVEKYLFINDWSEGAWELIKARQKELKSKDVGMEYLQEAYPHLLYKYNGKDVLYTYRLWNTLQEKLPSNDNHRRAYKFLCRASRTLIDMEKTGICINKKYFEQFKKYNLAIYEKCVEVLHGLPEAQEAMALGTTKGGQNGDITASSFLRNLAIVQKIPITETTKGGLSSIGTKKIEELAENYSTWKLIKQGRDSFFMVSKFLKNFEGFIDKQNVLHTTYKLTKVESEGGTVTGRLASSPNVQNIKKDMAFRKCFMSPKDFYMVAIDYPQIEMRVAATLANCKVLLKEINAGADPHADTTRLIYKIPESQPVDKKLRGHVKSGVFGKLYGQQIPSYAKQFGLNTGEAKRIFKLLDDKYPELHQYMVNTQNTVKANSPIITPFGRRRVFKMDGDIEAVMRQAGNFEIQSTASDICLQKACEINEQIVSKYKGKVYLINTVHDALYLIIHKDYLIEILPQVQRIMADMSTLPFKMLCPLPVDEVEIGKSWGKMKEYKNIEEVKNEFCNDSIR